MYKVYTTIKEIMADTITPVGVYLKLRDKYPHSILLESSDYHGHENSTSIIGLNPLAQIIIKDNQIKECIHGVNFIECKLDSNNAVLNKLEDFFKKFQCNDTVNEVNGFFGYTSFDAVKYLGYYLSDANTVSEKQIPDIYYSLYEYVIVIDHFNDTAKILKNSINDEMVDLSIEKINKLEQEIRNINFAVYPFKLTDEEKSDLTDDEYISIVEKAKTECKIGNVFQLVLSREFTQHFTGDEFNVYRALRMINPSSYLFYFDFGDFRLFGSSPEAQLIVKNNRAEIHPIAGTVKRSDHVQEDLSAVQALKENPKENSEHIMLVDLARNDLSRNCTHVNVEKFTEIQFYSHVIHMVSKVTGIIKPDKKVFNVFIDSFPAGTLSGAPKHKAIELINKYEKTNRGYYGAAIGYYSFNKHFNHAIIIRSFLSKNNTLFYRAGAGIVIESKPENELQEVNNKLGALKCALKKAQEINF